MATPFRLKRSAVSGKRPTLNDLQLGELAFNTYDAYLFGTRDAGGVGIGTTVTLLTPWTENFGAASIYYQKFVGIGTTNPQATLHVVGDTLVAGVSTFNTDVYVLDQLFVGGIEINGGGSSIGTDITTRNLNVTGISTLGIASASQLNVSGITTTATLNVGTAGTIINAQSGTVIIGGGTSTGTASQRLQVTGGAYVSGSVGIGTSNPRETLDIIGTVGVQASGSANRFEIQHNAALNSLDFIFI